MKGSCVMDDRGILEWRVFVLESTLHVTDGCDGSVLSIPSVVRGLDGSLSVECDEDGWWCRLKIHVGEGDRASFDGRGSSLRSAMLAAVGSMRADVGGRLVRLKSQLSSLGPS